MAEEEPDPLFDDLFDARSFEYPDPHESTNRKVFAFNRQVDKWFLDPLTQGYRFVLPRPVRAALSRMFVNLGSPKTIANDFLQLEWKDMSVTTTRFRICATGSVRPLPRWRTAKRSCSRFAANCRQTRTRLPQTATRLRAPESHT